MHDLCTEIKTKFVGDSSGSTSFLYGGAYWQSTGNNLREACQIANAIKYCVDNNISVEQK